MRLLVERFPETARDMWTDEDTVEVQVSRESVVETLRTLRDDPEFGFFMLADAAAVDYGVGKHFEVVYHLYSEKHPAWLRLRVRVERANPRTPSVTGLWTGAMFHEREMYDMMGIVFEGNRDLRRIYMSPDYRSFPQRKDFLLPDDAADSSAAGVTTDVTGKVPRVAVPSFTSRVASFTSPGPVSENDETLKETVEPGA